jgi:hypothetical protein
VDAEEGEDEVPLESVLELVPEGVNENSVFLAVSTPSCLEAIY